MGDSETSGADTSSGETSNVSALVTLDVGSLDAFNPEGRSTWFKPVMEAMEKSIQFVRFWKRSDQ